MSAVGELAVARGLRRPSDDASRPLSATSVQVISRPEPAQSRLPDDLSREVYCVLGIPIDVVDMSEALRRIDLAAAGRQPYLISTPNLNFLITSRTNTEFRESVIDSDLCPPDGMPIIWIARLMGLPIRQRVAGADIFDRLRKRFSPKPLKTFLFGGAAGTAEMVQQALNAKPVGLSCVGSFYPGYGSVDVMSSDEILNTINESHADFLAVALSAAKGQTWLYRNRARLQVPVRAQLGAAINFQAGTVKRAPRGVQKLGLEWLWRIKEEPALWKRYAHDGLSLLKLLVAQVLPIAVNERWLRLSRKAGAGELRLERLQDGDSVTLRFAGAATAEHVGDAVAGLREAMGSNATVAIDLSAVRAIDARFIGLLMMARKRAAVRGGRLIITRVSSHINRMLCLHGAEYLLSDRG